MGILSAIKDKICSGGAISRDEALELYRIPQKEELYRLGGEVRDRFAGNYFDTCSIVNARSGKCSEDCKWCAQSVHFKTSVENYELIEEKQCLELARKNAAYGVDKFSFVTSGRALSERYLDRLCEYAVKIQDEMELNLCASMGLLNRQQLQKLKNAGISRYHCNLESSPRFFPHLCTSHTQEEKLHTLRDAREVGMEVCSGGIIGMGETAEDRIDLALLLRVWGVTSIPLNILNPIPGTPLEGTAPLSDEEILTTVAIFRLIHPGAFIRFAGGRLLIAHLEEAAIRAGVNAAIMGDMLTTPGSRIEEDLNKVKDMGFIIDRQ